MHQIKELTVRECKIYVGDDGKIYSADMKNVISIWKSK